VPIGYQLYSSRRFGPRPATLAMLARAGYAHVETAIPPTGDRAALRRLADELAAAGLAMPSAHVALDLLAEDPGWVVEAARLLGAASVYAAWLPSGRRPADRAGWAAFGAELDGLGAPLRQAGIAFGWHNHDYEFAELPEGGRALAAIFAGGPSLEWQADVGWIARAGADPLRWVEAHAARLSSVHLKDLAPEGAPLGDAGGAGGGWAELGAGVLPWPALLPVLAAAAPRTWIVEHDEPPDDARFAAGAIAFLRSALGPPR
jgi:sugar phosphate isomerase/epimerase